MKKCPRCYWKLCGCKDGACACEHFYPADAETEDAMLMHEQECNRDGGYEDLALTEEESAGLRIFDSVVDYLHYEAYTNEFVDERDGE